MQNILKGFGKYFLFFVLSWMLIILIAIGHDLYFKKEEPWNILFALVLAPPILLPFTVGIGIANSALNKATQLSSKENYAKSPRKNNIIIALLITAPLFVFCAALTFIKIYAVYNR